MSSKIITLSDSQDNTLIPKTKLEAISDANGDYLSSSLTASDINALTSNSVVTHDDISVHSSIPINADRLNGHADTYFAMASALSSLIKVTTITTNFSVDSRNIAYGKLTGLTYPSQTVLLAYAVGAYPFSVTPNSSNEWHAYNNYPYTGSMTLAVVYIDTPS